MSFLVLSASLGLFLAPQVPPQPVDGGTTASARSRSADSSGAPSLADVLTRMQSTSGGNPGGGGRFAPLGGTNVRVNSLSTASQFGPTIAVDPTDPFHLVGAATDDRNEPGYRAAVFHASFDGGLTWTELFRGGPSAQDHDETAAAFGADGEVYFCARWNHGDGTVLYVGRSFDGGVTVPDWIEVDDGWTNGPSQPELAVDRGTGPFAGSVYLVFDSFGSAELPTEAISITVSTDGGQTWRDTTVSDSLTNRILSPSVAVDSSGVVHVAWYDQTLRTIETDSSPDAGSSWGTDVQVAGVKRFSIPHLATSVLPAPKIAADTSGGPFHGTLYVTWAQDGGAGVPDVVLSKSSDGGASWSTPIVVSDVTTNSQFTPSITVDPQGNVVVGFYDRRDDPADVRVNFYVARSSDGGATFQRNVKVSDADFDPTSYATGVDIVTRTGVAASDQLVHAIWTDGRNGDNDIYTAPVALDFSTDVETLSASAGGTVTFTVSPGPLFQSDGYQIVGSTSGTTPGTDLYFVHLPLNYDGFMLWTILLANSSFLPAFTGTLDATGAATASMVSGPLPPSLVGFQMDFAALVEVGSAFRWASNPTHLSIGI